MNSGFLDIFSFKKQKAKKEGRKTKIFVDYREKNSLVTSELSHLGMEIEFLELKVGDYLVNNVAIERKTVSDFFVSMANKRLSNQLEELKQYENRLLIIEGIGEQELYSEKQKEGIHSNSIRGFLLSILLKYKTPVIYSKDYKDTAIFISLIAKKQERESSLNVRKKALNKKEQLQFIVEGFPGIGPKTAKKLLQNFGTIKNLLNSSFEDIQKLIGKKAEIFRIVDEKY